MERSGDEDISEIMGREGINKSWMETKGDTKPVYSEESEADQGAVEGEGKDSQLKGAPGSKHLRLLPADDKLTGGGSPVASDEAES